MSESRRDIIIGLRKSLSACLHAARLGELSQHRFSDRLWERRRRKGGGGVLGSFSLISVIGACVGGGKKQIGRDSGVPARVPGGAWG